jgi:hypothetical protein
VAGQLIGYSLGQLAVAGPEQPQRCNARITVTPSLKPIDAGRILAGRAWLGSTGLI